MADRSFIIEVLLKARDDTARAFASAMGEMAAYDAALDKQRSKNDALVESNGKLIRSNKELEDVTGRVAQGHVGTQKATQKIIDAQARYQKSTEDLTRSQARQRDGDLVSTQKLTRARAEQNRAEKALTKAIADKAKTTKDFQKAQSMDAATEFRLTARRNALHQEELKILTDLESQTKKLSSARDVRDINRISGSIRDLKDSMSSLGAESEAVDHVFSEAFNTARLEQHRAAQERNTESLRRYQSLVDNVARAEQRRDTVVNRPGIRPEHREIIEERLNVDVKYARAKLEEFSKTEEAHAIHKRLDVSESDISRAKIAIEGIDTGRTRAGSGDAGGGGGGGILTNLRDTFAELDTTTSGFQQKLRSAFGFAAVGLIQPLMALVLGLSGAFVALGSAVFAAGTALGGVFLSSIAQGIPVIGLLGATMQRFASIVQYVSAAHQQLQQRFIAGYQTAQQNAMGINQLVIAQHNYSDALFAVGQAQVGVTNAEHNYSNALYAVSQAEIGVTQAQHNLTTTRLQAQRQLQDLILQEEAAKLAADASSKSVADAQKALRAAIATGGDVQGAQLQLQQAQLGHQQATVNASRAVADAARGSVSRQQIADQVAQAQRAVTQAHRSVVDAQFSARQARTAIVQAERSVVDAQFAAQQARASIIQARQAASGYNVAIAAQLAWLRSQMTNTEKALAGNITRIFNLFQGAHGRLRPFTDAILQAFIPITGRILQLVNDPKLMGAVMGLAQHIGGAISTVGRSILGNQSIQNFITLINESARNLAPLANIAVSFFKSLQSIAIAVAPAFHQFLLWIGQIVGHFAAWAASTRGQNWLKRWFDDAFNSLKAFISFAGSLIRLIAAIAGVGGGAKVGIGLLNDLRHHIDNTTNSINSHGSAFRTLHRLWESAKPALSVLGNILRAVGRAFLQVGGTPQGRAGMRAVGDLITRILIPAFVQFAIDTGRVIGKITEFLRQHPRLASMLKTVIAFGLTASFLGKGVGLIFGPLSAVFGLLGNIVMVLSKLPAMIEALGPLWAVMLNPITLVAAAIVGIIVATGNFGNLIKTISAPFKEFWNQIKGPLENLGRQFTYFVNSILSPFGVHFKNTFGVLHAVVKGLLGVVKFVFVQIADVVVKPFKAIAEFFGGLFEIIGGLIHGNGHKIVQGFKTLGKGILDGLRAVFLAIPELLLNFIKKMIHAVASWLGIASPSRRMRSIGESMVDGLVNGLRAVVELPLKIIRWIGQGLGKLSGWLFGIGKDILKWILHGAQSVWHDIASIGSALGDWIWNGIKTIASKIIGFGKWIIQQIIKGIKSAPGAIVHAIGDLIPSPVKGVIKGAAGLASDAFNALFARGGPVGSGYGGGDRVPARLEQGEHVWTKDEVRSAGGHGAMFALRRFFGGGGQGGPFGYARGGAVPGLISASASQSRNTQGVTGDPGASLANIQLFIKNFTSDWRAMWINIQKQTNTNIRQQEQAFNDLLDRVTEIWDNIGGVTRKSLRQLLNNFKDTFTTVDKDTFNAFWYIQHAANQSLKAFGAKPVDVTLGAVPKFAGGGIVGALGERGKDLVPALLGRGEAVLNWAHQKVVEPALNAFYGFGLQGMFKRMRGEHAEQGNKRGYAAGGYVFPFSGKGWAWDRTDQGVDFGGNAPIGAIGDARVTYSNPNDGWYSPAPAFMVYKLLNGPDAGKFIYVAEHISNMAPEGAMVKAGHAVAQMVGGIETGWAAGPKGHQIIQPMGGDHLTAAGKDFHRFLTGLQHGQIVGGSFGGERQFQSSMLKNLLCMAEGCLLIWPKRW
jgi:hypothetical protein